MKNKKVIISIFACLLCVLLGWLGFILYENQTIRPGVEGLAKRKVGIFYCAYNDEMVTVIDKLKTMLNTNAIEIETSVPYPKDEKQFNERIKQENQDITRVVLNKPDIDLQKYDYMIFATPIINDRPCPAMQRFILDKYKTIEKKPISVLVLYKKGNLPRNTMLFFTRRLALSIWKDPYITKMKEIGVMEFEMKMWFKRMKFKRKELRHKN